GKRCGQKNVSCRDYIGSTEVDDAVSIGSRIGNMDHLDTFVVEVDVMKRIEIRFRRPCVSGRRSSFAGGRTHVTENGFECCDRGPAPAASSAALRNCAAKEFVAPA